MGTTVGESFKEVLNSIGVSTVNMNLATWVKYHKVLMPIESMPVFNAEMDLKAIERKLVEEGCWICRYYTKDSESRTWWHVVCRSYDKATLSSNTRSHINRGMKRNRVEMIEFGQINMVELYRCHVSSYSRYSHAKPLAEIDFVNTMRKYCECKEVSMWVSYAKEGKILGYIMTLKESDGIFMHTIDITPEGLRAYASAAIISEILEYYINRKSTPVCNGTRSISHDTNMQHYLSKFGFNEEFCKLNLVYRAPLGALIQIIYPFRKLFMRMKTLPGFRQLSVLLFQESCARGDV